MLTEFNKGGSHDQNPLGGIPQGQNADGGMNTVEQGETKKGSYVYSDRLYINEDLAKAMNLPAYIKGKTFASASKAINDKFKDRNDIHTKATQKELLDRLTGAQEQLKAEEAAINQSMQANQNQLPSAGSQFEDGGFMDFINKNGSSLGGLGAGLGTMINPGGTFQSQIKNSNDAGFENTHLQQNQQYGQAIDGVQGAVAKSFGPIGEAVFGAKKLGESIGGAIGGEGGAIVSSLISPEKAALANWTDKDMKFGDKLLGTLPVIGGIKANKSAEKKLEAFKDNKRRTDNFYQYQFNENDDETKVFAKGGYMNSLPNNKAYRKGGFTDPENPLFKKPMIPNAGYVPPVDNSVFPNGSYEYKAPQPEGDAEYLMNNKGKYDKNRVKEIQGRLKVDQDGIPGKITYNAAGLIDDGSSFPAMKSRIGEMAKPSFTNSLDQIVTNSSLVPGDEVPGQRKGMNLSKYGQYANDALRYAPIIGNLLQKGNIGPAEVEAAMKNPYQYKKQYLDNETYRKAAEQQSAATMEALNKSGMSANQLMAGSLSSQLGRTKAVAEGEMAAKMHNIGENKIAEGVKQGIETDFLADKRRINDVNAQNRANRDTQASKFDAEIYNSLGEIGKENVFKQQAEKLTGYKWMGDYLMNDPDYKTQFDAINNDKSLNNKEKYARQQELMSKKFAGMTAEDLALAEAQNKELSTRHLAMGGYLNNKFKKY